jgi:hypothetical protein
VKISDIPFILRHSVANRGVIRSVGVAGRKVMGRLSRPSAPAKQLIPPHPFDAEFKTDTGGMVYAQELRDGRGKKSIYNTAYYGTPPSMFLQALARLQIDFPEFTFIDLGAGKGRVLLLASNFPFRQVIGVEFSEHLAGVANRNISLYQDLRRCNNVSCTLGDASEFAFPAGPLVLFMWHPFVGAVFARMLSNLEESLQREPREVYLLYLNPECGRQLDNCSGLHKIWECTLQMTEQDFAFYGMGGRTQACVAYRSSVPGQEAAGRSTPASVGGIA